MGVSLERVIDHQGFVDKWESRLADSAMQTIDIEDFFGDFLAANGYPNGCDEGWIELYGEFYGDPCTRLISTFRGLPVVEIIAFGSETQPIIPDLTKPPIALQTARDIFINYMATLQPKQV